jgi:hypothetical protein
MGEPIEELAALRRQVSQELATPVRPSVAWLAERIRERHGDAVLGVLFYGSCLRQQTDEGVLDFWVVVDDYRRAHARRSHAWINRVAPPNVYYLEQDHGGATLRTKYGVLDRGAFERGTALSALHPYVWARFAQPARLIAARDEAARDFFERCVAEAIVTMVGRLVCFLPAHGAWLRFSFAALWQEAFRRTYDSERRPEAEELIRDLYRVDETRYDAVAGWAMPVLVSRGHFASATPRPRACEVEIPELRQRLQRLRWRLMRPWARMLGLVRLLKTAFTFGDWVPYVLWKLERHTGRRIEPTERQRRHPLIFGWPIILPLLLRRNLR